MNILIDIGHPAHVHYFKNFARILLQKGHQVLFTSREKEYEKELLEYYGFKYYVLGKKYNSKIMKLLGLAIFNWKILKIALRYKPDIFLSAGSMYAAQVAWLLKKPHISLEDTGNKEQVNIYKPFTKEILTSDFFPFDYGQKQIRYRSFQELAYLHPNYFIPDNGVLKHIGLEKDEKYVLIRLVAWNATHDTGQCGIKESDLAKIAEILEEKGYKIFISSEAKLPLGYQGYQIKIPPHHMHNVLYFADLYIGEGATMAMEAALLGTPSIYVNSLRVNYCVQMEIAGLMEICSNSENLIQIIDDYINHPDFKAKNRIKVKEMIEFKIDPTAFLVWFIENYPGSVKIMKENPSFQDTFR